MKTVRVTLVAAFLLSMLALAAPAQAQSYPPDVLGDVIRRDPTPVVEPDVLNRPPTPEPGILPFTGADIAQFVLIGAVAIAAGSVIARRYRVRDLA